MMNRLKDVCMFILSGSSGLLSIDILEVQRRSRVHLLLPLPPHLECSSLQFALVRCSSLQFTAVHCNVMARCAEISKEPNYRACLSIIVASPLALCPRHVDEVKRHYMCLSFDSSATSSAV